MAVTYRRIRVKNALSRSGLPDIDYAFNPYAGCAHGCLYCYARAYTRHREVAENWGQIVYIKENVLEVLAREVRRQKPGVVGVSTITDPYQPVEAQEKLTRRGIQILLEAGFHVSIQTKSPLVLRDLNLLAENKQKVDVGFTIITLDSELSRLLEPGAPSPIERARALEEISARGIETWVFLGPILRGVNDSTGNLSRIVQLAAKTGSILLYDFLRMKPGLNISLSPVLQRYPLALSTSRSWRKAVCEKVEKLCAEAGVKCEPAFPQPRKKGKSFTSILDY